MIADNLLFSLSLKKYLNVVIFFKTTFKRIFFKRPNIWLLLTYYIYIYIYIYIYNSLYNI